MGLAFRRLLGLILILAAVVGLIFSILGIIWVWNYKQSVTESLVGTVDLLDLTLQATTEALEVADDSLTRVATDVDALGTTIQATGRAIQDTSPIVDELSSLVANDLPDAINSTQTALTTAQSSAQLIESLLRVISSIPLLPLDPYNPPVPLDIALGNVVSSLETIPASLETMETALETSQENLIEIQIEFDIMAGHIREIKTNLTDAQLVIGKYQEVVSTLHQQIRVLKAGLPAWINVLAWFLTIALIWLGLTQLGLLAQGLEMFGARPQVLVVEEPEEVVVVKDSD